LQLHEACRAIEAILFVAGDAVEIKELAQALEVNELEAVNAVDELQREYDRDRRGMMISRYGNHLKMETRADYAPYVERLLQPVQRQSLSQAAMETLAVIAYRQPVTRLDIEEIRGVKCDYSVQSLLNKGLIKNVGRKEALGRPYLYATTDFFLEHFGIADIRELPPLPEANPQPDAEPLVP
jgi:segregation and condensation protein B